MKQIALVGGTVLDGTGAAANEGMTVLIDGDEIVGVEQGKVVASQFEKIDFAGTTVMPGLIDCHAHMAVWHLWLITEQKHSLMYLAGQTIYNLRATLESGCTTVRDLGGLEAGFAQAQRDKLIQGPRLQTAVSIIQPTNGLTDCIPGLGAAISPQGQCLFAPGIPQPWADGPWKLRSKVREVIRNGADVVKIANCGAPFRPGANRSIFTTEELEAVVDEAHRAGRKVSVHSNFSNSTREAVDAGVDTVEHGTVTDRETADVMAQKGVWLVPTLTNHLWHLRNNPDEKVRESMKPLCESVKKSFKTAMKAGVPIAMGTDAAFAAGLIASELTYMVECGMTPLQAIKASTSDAAKCMGIESEVGTVAAGMKADLLIVDGDPSSNIEVLEDQSRLLLVMQDGRAVAGPLSKEFQWERIAPLKYWN